jgi:ATP-dependent DNA helicase RecG
MFPGKCILAHGGMTSEEKENALNAMHKDGTQLLISTTLCETGLNLNRLRHVAIINAECYGLSTLHQIRGRVARLGGQGWCDLLPSEGSSEKVVTRLGILEQTADSFAIATHDLKLRGAGDLSASSSLQSGADETFLLAALFDSTFSMK